MSVTYRLAVASDAAQIADMEARYVDCPWTVQQVTEEIYDERALFYVAEQDGVIGFLSGIIAADECEISNIAVESAFRRRGIARTLFEKLFSDAAARGARQVYLLVRDDNAPAIALYKSLGFTKVGTRSGYYGAFAANIMQKYL